MNRAQRRAMGVRRARKASSEDAGALLRAAVSHHQCGRFAEAEDLYRRVLAAEPRNPDALHLLGLLANQFGRVDLAIDLIGQAIAAHPRRAAYPFSLGAVLRGAGRWAEAAEVFRTAARLDPRNAEVQLALGGAALMAAPRDDGESAYEEAARAFGAVVRLQPDRAEAHCDLAIALAKLGRLDEALAGAREAVRLKPGSAEGLTNLGVILKDLGLAEAALDALDRADALKPDTREIHFNRGNALVHLLRLDEAVAAFDRAIALGPDQADARFSRATARLLAGDLERGFEDYEWRKGLNADLAMRAARGPALKRGEALDGKTLYIHAEQGLGDTLQFCRYASLAADRGARVVLAAQDELRPLLAGLDDRITLTGLDQAPPAFDVQAALASLPHLFGTTLDSIPSRPAYLEADAALRAAWADRLGARRKPRIGLVWAGNPRNARDRQRSIPLARMAALLDEDADWISLHKDIRDDDRAALREHTNLKLFGEALTDFAETAALVDHLDLVVATDTAVAHLAGAMGKPVFVLLPFSPDWRWLLGRQDTPWYPSARLFRQPAPGDWAAALDQVKAAIAERAGRP